MSGWWRVKVRGEVEIIKKNGTERRRKMWEKDRERESEDGYVAWLQ